MKKQQTDATLNGFRKVQRLAYEAATTVGKEIRPGWTEIQAADLMGVYLKDNGVKAFFHEPFAWFGERTRFDGINRKKYHEFNPTDRCLQEEEAIILDVAPILNGYVGDIGYTLSLNNSPELKKALTLLSDLRNEIPKIFSNHPNDGKTIYKKVENRITQAGFDNCHKIYPFNVLGHRLKRVPLSGLALKTPFRFSLHSFYQILTNGFTSELLNEKHEKDLSGLWAIEPHIGGNGFGAKFEEILVVETERTYWLDDHVPHKK